MSTGAAGTIGNRSVSILAHLLMIDMLPMLPETRGRPIASLE